MKRVLIFLFFVFCMSIENVYACTTCTIGQMGQLGKANLHDEKWSFDYIFEQNNWSSVNPQVAHALHHDGHDAHGKTTEDFHHFKLGYRPTERLKLSFDFPYVIRRSLEVDSHSILGSKQRSEGPGDAHLVGDYRFWQRDGQSVGIVGGFKLPTGATKEKNSIGNLFEPELQPGSGSLDYILGGVYQIQDTRTSLIANTSYVFINKGEQEYKAGDVFTLSLYADYLVNPNSRYLKTRLGADIVYQLEQEDVTVDTKSVDSGGATLLMGPVFKIATYDRVSFSSSILFPVYQNLGGVHQELDYQWTLGTHINW